MRKTSISINLPAPHPAQRQVLAEAKRFSCVCCGRRWGKTVLGIDRLVEPALKGFPCAWFAPSYKSLAESWREIQSILAPAVVHRLNAEHRVELAGGGSIAMWSLESEVADMVRGRKYKRVVVDEAALIHDLLKTWETAIRPTLTDLRGDAWFLSTPRGMNDFHTLYGRGQDPERRDWASWQMPSITNPHIPADEIESARLDLTEGAFSQEFLALFVSWEGAVFRRILEAAIAAPAGGPEPGHSYVIGADWGRSNDYTVFVVLDETTRSMVYMDRSNRIDYTVQRGRLNALNERWKPSTIIVELNSIGQPIFEGLLRDGLPVRGFTTTNQSKAVAIDALALAFEKADIRVLNNPVLLGELQAFQAEQLPGGSLRYSAPGGQHDDCVMALALAWHAIPRPDRCLGLLDYVRDLQNQTPAPAIASAELRCPDPACGSAAVARVTSGFRCNQCGKQFGRVEPVREPVSRYELHESVRHFWLRS